MSRKGLLVKIFVLLLLAQASQPAIAETERVVLEMSVQGYVEDRGLTTQAEALVEQSINRYFRQPDGVSELEIVVLADRQGEILPILTTTVSREQWRQSPQVSAWTQYYSASYALLRRYDAEPVAVAVAPVSPTGYLNRPAQADIDAAFDEGRLTGQLAQAYLTQLD